MIKVRFPLAHVDLLGLPFQIYLVRYIFCIGAVDIGVVTYILVARSRFSQVVHLKLRLTGKT